MSQTAHNLIRTAACLTAYGILSVVGISGVYLLGLTVMAIGEAIG